MTPPRGGETGADGKQGNGLGAATCAAGGVARAVRRADRPVAGRARWCVAVALLLLVSAAAYFPALHGEFTNFDDDEFVTRNTRLRAGLTGETVRWAFTSFYASNWVPLTWVSHLLDVSLFGFEPRGHHLVNVLFHGANALILFFVLRALTGAGGRSLFAAALFSLHPLHVESVAWVAERRDVLSTFFWFLALGAHQRYALRPTVGRYLATAALVVCGLLAKPMVVMLPVVLLLLDLWPLGRLPPGARFSARRLGLLLLEKVPLLALAAGAGALTFMAQLRGNTVAGLEAYPLSSRLLNVPVAYAGYLGKMAWPANLGPFYPVSGTSLTLARVGLSLVLLVLVSVLVVRLRRGHPWLFVGWLWYLATLIPVIGLVQVGSQALADRYTYVPLLGPFIMAAWGIPEVLPPGRRRGVFLGVGAATVALLLAGLTWIQAGFWRDSITLMTRAIRVAGGGAGRPLAREAWILPNKLGNAYSERGRHELAAAAYRQALAANPRAAEVHYNLGNAYFDLGRLEAAAGMFREAVRLQPDFADAWFNLGSTSGLLGRGDESRRAFERAALLEAGGANTP